MGQTEPLGEGCHRSRWLWKRDALNGRYSSHSVTLGEVGAAGGGMEGPRARSGRAEVRSMTCRAAVRAAAANSQRAGYRVSGGGGRVVSDHLRPLGGRVGSAPLSGGGAQHDMSEEISGASKDDHFFF